MGVPLGDPNVSVTEDFLNDSQMHVLTNQQGACGVSSVVKSGVREPSSTQDGRPLVPVSAWVDRPSVRLAEDKIIVSPCGAKGCSALILRDLCSRSSARTGRAAVRCDGSYPLVIGVLVRRRVFAGSCWRGALNRWPIELRLVGSWPL